ncbi:hypothetical protein NLJ89_g1462 [Agrocybe chaxingu]|uniref:F-box domain-containing protein n=1 Tax=Agrocybe chaxingu TaxID=84603 RepID=A0A9W8MZZ5_9AGAR|nr:hypothetical protein NLJ89_g1462 [Agrocybe chaxingu]
MNRVHNPTSKLPPEVVSRIFAFCPSVKCIAPADGASIPKMAQTLVLGGVCRRWRSIAWTTPSLWTGIRVFIEHQSPQLEEEMVGQWLARSGCLPLSIHVLPQRFMVLNSHESVPPLIDILNRYSSRWETLDLQIPLRFVSWFRGDSGPVSILKNLFIRDYLDIFPFRNSTSTFILVNNCPTPAIVQVYGIPFRSLSISWNGVTHVRLGEIYGGELFHLLQVAPFMTICNITEVKEGDGGFGSPQDLTHHRLQDLNADYQSSAVAEPILSRLTLPSLTDFLYRDLSFGVLRSLMSRSSPPIRYLHIADVNATEEEFIEIFYSIPTLEELAIYHLWLGEDFLKLLASTAIVSRDNGDVAKFLPKLVELTAWFEALYSWRTLATIFPSGPVPSGHWRRPLKTVQIHCMCTDDEEFMDEEAVSQLLAVRNAGIALKATNAETGWDFIHESWKYLKSQKASDTEHAEDEDMEGAEDGSDDESKDE